jgi:hypothetical protein
VTITGVSLKQTTNVTFGGVKATTFTANSDMQVTATVPSNAVTGKIAITTSGGIATSSGIYTVSAGGRCGNVGAQCGAPILPPCCAGLVCTALGNRAFCEPHTSAKVARTRSSWEQAITALR